VQTILNDIAKIAENLLNYSVVNADRLGIILGEFDDGVENVASAGDCSK